MRAYLAYLTTLFQLCSFYDIIISLTFLFVLMLFNHEISFAYILGRQIFMGSYTD
jgi:hypothetical protein